MKKYFTWSFALKVVGACLMIYLTIVMNVYRFSNPEKTETELILSMPKAIVLDFTE